MAAKEQVQYEVSGDKGFVAKPSEKDLEYLRRAEKMAWKDLNRLWDQIKAGDAPGWEDGKALEHLVIRAFQLNKLEVEYPYNVPPGGATIEQIDGLVYLNSYVFLVECKDKETVDFEAFAKLRSQLLRRPDTTFGCVFTGDRFTEAALILADFALPHRILVWSGVDIESCFRKKNFGETLLAKYRHLCKYGFTDHSPNYKDVKL